MKTFIFLLSLMVVAETACAATMKQVAGAYDVSFKALNTNMIANVKEDGHLDLEVFSLMYLSCSGEAGRLEKNIFIINPSCNGAQINLKIDLSQVKNFNKFKAPVYTSMLGRTVEMEFTRR